MLEKGYSIVNADLVPLVIDGVDNINLDITDSGQLFNALSGYANIPELKSGKSLKSFKAVVHLAAIPRILMGIIIAFTISKPMELKMFSTEIDVKLVENQQDQKKKFTEKIASDFDPKIADLREEIAELRSFLKEKEEEKISSELAYSLEIDGDGGTGNRGFGPVAREKDSTRQRIMREFEELKLELKPRIND